MIEWKDYKLGDLAEITSSKRIFYSDYVSEGIRFYRSKEIIEKSLGETSGEPLYITKERFFDIKNKYGVPVDGDLLISAVGERAGIPFVVKELGDFYFKDGNLIWLRNIKPDLNIRFFYYWIKSPIGQITLESIMIGSAQKALTIAGLKNLDISIPKPTIQKAIATALSCLDDKSNLLHRQNKTLEKIAETLFRKFFVQPIKKITDEGTVVEGFVNAKFEKWIKETVGGEWGKENSEEDYIKPVYCIRGTDIADLNTGIPEKMPVRYVKEGKFKNIEPAEGDLILEISGGTENQSTGRVCYINNDIKNLFKYQLVFSNFCRMIRVKKPEFSFFLYCYIQYLYNQDEFFNLENGSSGIKNLDYKALLFELEFPMPNEEIVIEFHNIVAPLFKKINQNKTQIRLLNELRKTLLPKLMSGLASIDI